MVSNVKTLETKRRGKMTALVSLSFGSLSIVVTNGPAGVRDWVGIFDPDADNNHYLDWRYLNNRQVRPSIGLSTGTITMPAPKVDGYYEIRFLTMPIGRTEFQLLATSSTFSIGCPGTINLTPSPPTGSGNYSLIRPDGTNWGTVRVG